MRLIIADGGNNADGEANDQRALSLLLPVGGFGGVSAWARSSSVSSAVGKVMSRSTARARKLMQKEKITRNRRILCVTPMENGGP